jgi:hypothetical protein
MEITVKDTSAAENLIKNYSLQWRLRTAKVKSRWLLSYALAGSMILLGIVNGLREKSPSALEELTHMDFDTFIISFGIVYAFFSLQNQLAWRKLNKTNLTVLRDVADLFKKKNNESILTFTDEFVIVDQYNIHDKTGWDYFNYYTLHNNLLILHKNPAVIENIVVDRNLISETEFDELLFFVSERLKPHKN